MSKTKTYPVIRDIVLRVETTETRWWMTPSKGDLEGTPTEVPFRTKRGNLSLQSVAYCKKVLEAICDIFEPSDASVKEEIEGVLRKVFAELTKELRDAEKDRLEEIQRPPKELTSEQEDEARKLLASPDFLRDVVPLAFRDLGVVGEEANLLALYLASLTRFSSKPVHHNLKASSSAGKNYLLEKLKELLPEEDVICIDRITAQALFYSPHLNLKNKVLILQEVLGAEDALYSLRTLQEEGKLTILVTVTRRDKAPESEKVEVEGPCVVFMTTTKEWLGDDEESRTLSLTLDESSTQTRNINWDYAARFESKVMLDKEMKERIRNVQRLVRTYLEKEGLLGLDPEEQVYAPWLAGLAGCFPHGQLRSRRDFPRISRLVTAYALLFSPLGGKRDDRGRLLVPIDVYESVREIYSTVFEGSLMTLSPGARRILEGARRFAERLAREAEPGEGVVFTRRDLEKELGWSTASIARHVKPLEGTYLGVDVGPRGMHMYSLLLEPQILQLPTVDEVRQAFFSDPGERERVNEPDSFPHLA